MGCKVFADMPAPLLKRWIDWANSHDWGGTEKAYYDEQTKELVCFGQEYRGVHYINIESRFTNYQDMKDWAGY